jgi:hypothetical protein
MGLHRQRFAIVVAAGAGMLATFLPWFHVPILGSVLGADGVDGWITLALFVPAMVLGLCGVKLRPVVGFARFGAVIPAGFAALVGISKLTRLADFKSRRGAVWVSTGIGIYLLIASGLALVIVAWVLAKSPQQKPPSQETP